MLHGKIALVTGASKGIGSAIAIALAKEGAYVYINYNGSKVFTDLQKIAEDGKVENPYRYLGLRREAK